MASASDSTTAPSRRQFFGSAVGAGVAATAPPIFTVASASSLAITCAWATEHLAWMAIASRGDDWDDERIGHELDRYGLAFRRAVNEPSASVGDIRAKAKMLLADLVENEATPFAELSDDERLMRVLLREIIALPSA